MKDDRRQRRQKSKIKLNHANGVCWLHESTVLRFAWYFICIFYLFENWKFQRKREKRPNRSNWIKVNICSMLRPHDQCMFSLYSLYLLKVHQHIRFCHCIQKKMKSNKIRVCGFLLTPLQTSIVLCLIITLTWF